MQDVNVVSAPVVAKERGYADGMLPFVQLGKNIDRRFNGGVAGFLGDQYNDGLSLRDIIAPHATVDRMVAAHFELSDADLEKAKAVHVSIQDVNGPLWETTASIH